MSKIMMPSLWGNVDFQSNLSIEEVGQILSEKLFSGLLFGGKEDYIHEEIPAIYIQKPFMGLLVILDGYPGFEENEFYTLHVKPSDFFFDVDEEIVELDKLLEELFRRDLGDVDCIKLYSPPTPF